MFQLANDIKGKIQDIPGIADLNVEQQIERPQLVIKPRREMLARHGITMPQFSEFVSACLAGEAVSQVYEQGKSFDLVVRVRHDLHDEMDKVRDLMIDTADATSARWSTTSRPASTQRFTCPKATTWNMAGSSRASRPPAAR